MRKRKKIKFKNKNKKICEKVVLRLLSPIGGGGYAYVIYLI